MDHFTSSENSNDTILPFTASFSSISDDAFEDSCCICLQPFTSNDPSTITSCKHEYHLQCILEWSQRSTECPICCQLLVLKDPIGQELLAAMASERLSKSRIMPSAASTSLHFHENFDVEHVASHSDDSDSDDLIMQHLAAAASRARYVHRRAVRRNFGQVFFSDSDSPSDREPRSDSDSPSRGSLSEVHAQALSSVVPLDENDILRTSVISDTSLKPRVVLTETSSDSQQKKGQPDGFSFPDSIKSKFSATSVKCKESILRSTQGFKEKLLARNISVKEISKGVKREMSAGIAGVARMIDRLDLTSKRNATSVSFFSCNGGTSNSFKGKSVLQESIVTDDLDKIGRINTDSPSHVSTTIPGAVEVSLAQRGD